MSFCRAGLPLGATGPGDCREPVISAEEAAALNVRRQWCAHHGRLLAAAREPRGRRKPPTLPGSPSSATPAAPTKLPKRLRALRAARAVHAAGWLSKTDAAAAAGFEGSTGGFGRVSKYAREQGWIVSKRRGREGGYAAGAVAPPPDED